MLRPFLLALFGGAVVAGLVLAIVGPSTERRVLGFMAAYFALYGVTSVLIAALTPSRHKTVRLSTLDGEPAFVFPTSRAKLGRALVMVGVWTLFLLAAVIGSADVVLWLCVAFFAACTGFIARKFLRPPSLVLTPTGVTRGPGHDAWMPWHEVELVDTFQQRARYVRIKAVGGLAARMLDDFVFPAGGFLASDELVMASVARYVDDPERQARIGMEDELEEILAERS